MAQFYSANRRVATRERVTVSCDQLGAFGQGLARHRGTVMFIPGLLPGEQAEVRLTEDKRQYSRGEVIHRLNDAPERVTPRCPHYGVCGGCQQHISQALQQRTKAAALAQLLAREQPGAVPEVAQIGSAPMVTGGARAWGWSIARKAANSAWVIDRQSRVN